MIRILRIIPYKNQKKWHSIQTFTLPETNIALKYKAIPKENHRIPTIQFQVLLLLVSAFSMPNIRSRRRFLPRACCRPHTGTLHAEYCAWAKDFLNKSRAHCVKLQVSCWWMDSCEGSCTLRSR